MTIKKRLKLAQEKLQGKISEANELEMKKQQALQEALRLEGIIRELTLIHDEETGEKP